MLISNESGDVTNPLWSVSLSLSLSLPISLWPIHPARWSFEDLEHSLLDGEASLPVQGIGLPGVLDGSGSLGETGDIGVCSMAAHITSYLGSRNFAPCLGSHATGKGLAADFNSTW